jgi:hypothetical protein
MNSEDINIRNEISSSLLLSVHALLDYRNSNNVTTAMKQNSFMIIRHQIYAYILTVCSLLSTSEGLFPRSINETWQSLPRSDAKDNF